jgi:hypothetical protein
MKIRLAECLFGVDVYAGWEWFSTTKSNGSLTELIAVKNRSHNTFTQCPGT